MTFNREMLRMTEKDRDLWRRIVCSLLRVCLQDNKKTEKKQRGPRSMQPLLLISSTINITPTVNLN